MTIKCSNCNQPHTITREEILNALSKRDDAIRWLEANDDIKSALNSIISTINIRKRKNYDPDKARRAAGVRWKGNRKKKGERNAK